MKQELKFPRRVGTALVIAMSLMCSVVPQSVNSVSREAIAAPQPDTNTQVLRPKVEESYGKLPLSFEPNHGQAHKKVKFISRWAGYLVMLTETQATLAFGGNELRMKLDGGNSRAKMSPEGQLESVSNYLIGSDSQKWQTDVPNYSKVRLSKVYPNIDLVYYGSDQQRIEFDFIVAPGGDTSKIKLSFEGAESTRIDDKGNLILKMSDSEIIQPAPIIYQEVEGVRKTIDGRFQLVEANKVKFEIGEYDRTRELVIDPKIIYASYHGGSDDDRINDVTVDANGNAYLVGQTKSTNLNVTGGIQTTNRGGTDAFVVKVNPSGTQRIFSTYIGSNGTDNAESVALMSDGKICISGSADGEAVAVPFPTTSSRYQGPASIRGRNLDVFVTVLTSSASGLFYSTLLGGNDNDIGKGIAVDSTNKVYVSGGALSRNFPTKNEFLEAIEEPAGFIAKFDPAESGNDSLVYSSVIRGSNNAGRTDGERIAVTPEGVAFTTGTTSSTNLPVKSSSSLPPLQSSFGGGTQDVYIAKVSPTGSLIYLTYFGGDGIDTPGGIAVDSNERVYLGGFTVSSAATFPLRNAFDSTRNSSNDAFVAKLNADGTALFYSTLLSGSSLNNQIQALTIDAGGDVYVSGVMIGNPTLQAINGFQSSINSGGTFVAKIERSDATGTSIPRLLYFDTLTIGGPAGMGIDRKGNLIIAGSTSSNIQIPTELTGGVFQPNPAGGTNDGFMMKIASTFGDTIGVFRTSTNQFLLRNSNSSGTADLTKLFGGPGDLPIAGDWNGDGADDFGFFRPSTRQFFLKTNQLILSQTFIITFGLLGDLPIAGDWDGDGIDTIGVFRPATGEFFLSDGPNINSTPVPSVVFSFGESGDLPIAGDFDGDGSDGVGVFRPSTGEFFLNDDKVSGFFDAGFKFGAVGDFPVAGDWLGDGTDGVGVFRSSTGEFRLNNNNVSNTTDLVFVFGQNGDLPVAGNWNVAP